MRSDRCVLLALTDDQVAEVVRDAAAGRLVRSLTGLSDFEELHRVAAPLLADTRCSRETVRSLLVLVAFPADGRDVELTDVAARVGLPPSTMHRYVYAWRAVGLLEQDPLTRRYRRTGVSRLQRAAEGRGGDA